MSEMLPDGFILPTCTSSFVTNPGSDNSTIVWLFLSIESIVPAASESFGSSRSAFTVSVAPFASEMELNATVCSPITALVDAPFIVMSSSVPGTTPIIQPSRSIRSVTVSLSKTASISHASPSEVSTTVPADPSEDCISSFTIERVASSSILTNVLFAGTE